MDILDRDHEMGIPFDVDAEMERIWARNDAEETRHDDDNDDEK